MRINLRNNTSYPALDIIFDNKSYTLKKGENLLLCSSGANTVRISAPGKHSVSLNLLFALIDGFFDSESVVSSLYCGVRFDVMPQSESTTVTLKDLEARNDLKGYWFNSVYADGEVQSIRYSLTDTEKARRKAKLYHIFITSALPAVLLLLGLFAYSRSWAELIAAALLILCFTLPSLKRVFRLKEYFGEAFANERLKEDYRLMKDNGGEPIVPEPKGRIMKALNRLFEKLFGVKK